MEALSSKHAKFAHTMHDKLFRYAEFLGYGEFHVKVDEETGLRAIVAIHSTKNGPALGGCRCIQYPSIDKALQDVLRLAQMMSFKAAICGLPHGGGKSVLIKPKVIKNRVRYFEKFGEFVDTLNGRYIAAVDSGTDPTDMDIIATKTSYVTCTTKQGDGDPAPYTALGVRRGIEAAVKIKLNKNDLKGVRIAIQGAGHVGYYLAKDLIELGAIVYQTDINSLLLDRCVRELGVIPVAPEVIYGIECDVFSPCALGAILNLENIKKLHTKIVAGSANNQLAHQHYGDALHEANILYAPDFVINSGGLIQAAAIYDHGDLIKAQQQIYGLYDTMLNLFERAADDNLPTYEVAKILALENLKK